MHVGTASHLLRLADHRWLRTVVMEDSFPLLTALVRSLSQQQSATYSCSSWLRHCVLCALHDLLSCRLLQNITSGKKAKARASSSAHCRHSSFNKQLLKLEFLSFHPWRGGAPGCSVTPTRDSSKNRQSQVVELSSSWCRPTTPPRPSSHRTPPHARCHPTILLSGYHIDNRTSCAPACATRIVAY